MWHTDEFIAHLRVLGRAAGTILYSTLYVRYFIEYARTQCVYSADEVTPRLINTYQLFIRKSINRKNAQPIAQRTILARLVVLRSYFEYLAKNNFILMNPTDAMHLPKRSQHLPEIPRESEIKTLLESPDISTPDGLRDRAILELMYSSGLRRQEVINLNIIDIDLQKGIVRINKGKNRKDRIVPLGKSACRYIEEYFRTGRQILLKRTSLQKVARNPADPAVFVTRQGGRIKSAGLGYMVQKYMRRIFPGRTRLSCHSLRHACATHMLRGGASLRYIQQMLGHTSILTTEAYTHVDITDLKEAHKRCHPSDRRKLAANKVFDTIAASSQGDSFQ